MKLAYIEWVDAMYNAEWFTVEMAEHWHSTSDWYVKECGWLVKEDKEGITIAGRYKEADKDLAPQVGGLQFIPKPWIRKRVDLDPNETQTD